MSVRRTLFLLALITVTIPIAVGSLGASQPPTSNTEPIAPDVAQREARTQEVNAVETAPSVSALGTIEANEVAQLSFLTAGEIAEVLVEVGDEVSVGDVLVQLDRTASQIAYDQAVLNMERAEISLQELYEVDEIALTSAQASITSAQGSYSSVANAVSPEQIAAAELRYQSALTAYNAEAQARSNMNGSSEEIALQDAAVGAASFNLEIARLELDSLQNPSNANLWAASANINEAQLELEQLLAGPTQAQIDSAELAVQRAEAALIDAETALLRTQLMAPIAGVVTAVNVEPRDAVSAATLVVEISDLSQLWLVAPVHELDVSQIAEGMSASVRLDALPNTEIAATVETISWLGIETNDIINYDTWFALATNDSQVRLGMTGEATVEVAT